MFESHGNTDKVYKQPELFVQPLSANLHEKLARPQIFFAPPTSLSAMCQSPCILQLIAMASRASHNLINTAETMSGHSDNENGVLCRLV